MVKIVKPDAESSLRVKTKILILGSYYPLEAKNKLKQLKDYLVSVGFENTKLVEDFKFPVETNYLDHDLKAVLNSFYNIASSDILIFLFAKEADSIGAIMEFQKCSDEKFYGKKGKTLVLMEKGFRKKQGKSNIFTGTLKMLIGDDEIKFLEFKDDKIPFMEVREQLNQFIFSPPL
jgi:hypothetical protein